MAINYERIGRQVQQIRKRKGRSQADLAEDTGISHIETGIKKASLESIVKIANALGVTVDQILSGNQINNRSEYQSELGELMKDCTGYERGVIHDIAKAVKHSLRERSDLFPTEE